MARGSTAASACRSIKAELAYRDWPGTGRRGSRQLHGNLIGNPEVHYTDSGIARAMFRVAVSGRREQEASFFTVVVWLDQAKHVAESLSKGSRVVVVGRLQQRGWTAEDDSARSTVEVVAEELGPSCGRRRRPRPGRRGARCRPETRQRSPSSGTGPRMTAA